VEPQNPQIPALAPVSGAAPPAPSLTSAMCLPCPSSTSVAVPDAEGLTPHNTISDALGHKDPGITQRYYIRSGEAQQREATANLSGLLKRAATKGASAAPAHAG